MGQIHDVLRWLIYICRAAGHGKPVDIWAMGVITYFLLAGYTPFDRENQQLEMQAIIAGDFKFEPGTFIHHYPVPYLTPNEQRSTGQMCLELRKSLSRHA